MTTNVALLPCPCCGAAALESSDYNDCDGNPAIECSACNLLSWTPEDWNRRAHRQDGELLALCRQIVDEAIPATASGQTCFVPRYQLDKLRALSQPSEPSKSQVKRIALERGESPGLADGGEVGNA